MPQMGVWENDFAGPKYDMAPQQAAAQTNNTASMLGAIRNPTTGLPMFTAGQLSELNNALNPGQSQAAQGFNPTYQQGLGGYNPAQYATTDTANQLAQMLGANVVQTQMGPGSPFNVPPQNSLSFGTGSPLNAGLVAGMYARYPKAVADQMMADEMRNAGIGAGGASMSFNTPESQFNTNVQGGQNFLGRGTGQLPGANLGPNPTSNSGLNAPPTSAGTQGLGGNPAAFANNPVFGMQGNSGFPGTVNSLSGNGQQSGSFPASPFGFGGSLGGINPFALQSLAGLLAGSNQGQNPFGAFNRSRSNIGRAPGYTYWQPRGAIGGRNSLATGFQGFSPGAGSVMGRQPQASSF